jgi:hypothetical protein
VKQEISESHINGAFYQVGPLVCKRDMAGQAKHIKALCFELCHCLVYIVLQEVKKKNPTLVSKEPQLVLMLI